MLMVIEFLAEIGEDHTIRVPDEVPVGSARVIVLFEQPGMERKASMTEERRPMRAFLQSLPPGPRLFETPAEVDAYLQQERDNWNR